MILNFIFLNLNAITLSIWIIFLVFVSVRFFKPSLVKDISYRKIILITVIIYLSYGLFVSWGQYYVWANGGELTKNFINLPLSNDVPMSSVFEWTRPLFENNFGFFLYYILGRVWLDIFLTFIISSIFYGVFVAWNSYRKSFSDNGPELFLVLMLISGWPGLFVTIILGFIFSILFFIVYFFQKKKKLIIEPIFIFTTFFALLFTNIILHYVL